MNDASRNIVLLSSMPWNQYLGRTLSAKLDNSFHLISSPAELRLDTLSKLNPSWIMVPHWSHYIPPEIWSCWSTVIFHMTDLPYGRGGSPLQNLIKSGHTNSMISAVCCGSELDAGDIYLKEPLSLYGTAEEIFLRADALIELMIERIIKENPTPTPQVGEPVMFKRRKPKDSDLIYCSPGDLDSWQDHIRMLDAEGYPHAYLDVNGMKINFRRVSRRVNHLLCDAIIYPNSHHS